MKYFKAVPFFFFFPVQVSLIKSLYLKFAYSFRFSVLIHITVCHLYKL